MLMNPLKNTVLRTNNHMQKELTHHNNELALLVFIYERFNYMWIAIIGV